MFVLLLAAATLGNNAWLIGYEEQTVLVSAQANLYATDLPPDDEVNWDPGGGGPGRYPTQIPLPPKGKQRVVVFPRVAGAVAAGSNPPFALHGPEGNTLNSTNIGSYLGMSGIVHDSHSMFLAGVFLEEERSTTGAPPRLNVSSLNGEDITAPGIAQTFMIGDGRYGQPNSHGDFLQAFLVPPSATRLVLGFVDANAFHGMPGWYDDNRGRFEVDVQMLSSAGGLFVLDYERAATGSIFGEAQLLGFDPSGGDHALFHGGPGTHCYPYADTCLDISSPRFVSTGVSPAVGATRWIRVAPTPFSTGISGAFQFTQWDDFLGDWRTSNLYPGQW